MEILKAEGDPEDLNAAIRKDKASMWTDLEMGGRHIVKFKMQFA